MWNLPENGVSKTHQDFNKSCTKPPLVLSPMDTDTRLYLPKPDTEDCRCDVHGLNKKKLVISFTRYKQPLTDKKDRLHDELIKINREMTNLTSSMSYDTCDTDESMKSVYKTNYKKKSLSIAQYRPLIAAVNSRIGLPIITSVIADLRDAYRNPIGLFRYSAVESLRVQPAKTNNLLKSKQETCSFWDKSFASYSEYMDTISKMGLNNMKGQQQYLGLFSPSEKLEDCYLSKRRFERHKCTK